MGLVWPGVGPRRTSCVKGTVRTRPGNWKLCFCQLLNDTRNHKRGASFLKLYTILKCRRKSRSTHPWSCWCHTCASGDLFAVYFPAWTSESLCVSPERKTGIFIGMYCLHITRGDTKQRPRMWKPPTQAHGHLPTSSHPLRGDFVAFFVQYFHFLA